MTTRFEITLSTSEGALIRTLGLIQRRGFNVSRVDMKTADDFIELRLDIDACDRCPDVLKRQIERLHDVRHVRDQRSVRAIRPRLKVGRALMGLFASRTRVVVGSEA